MVLPCLLQGGAIRSYLREGDVIARNYQNNGGLRVQDVGSPTEPKRTIVTPTRGAHLGQHANFSNSKKQNQHGRSKNNRMAYCGLQNRTRR